jgi:hypothetical protein
MDRRGSLRGYSLAIRLALCSSFMYQELYGCVEHLGLLRSTTTQLSGRPTGELHQTKRELILSEHLLHSEWATQRVPQDPVHSQSLPIVPQYDWSAAIVVVAEG